MVDLGDRSRRHPDCFLSCEAFLMGSPRGLPLPQCLPCLQLSEILSSEARVQIAGVSADELLSSSVLARA